jgi:opacity protein-like surface antigen
MQAKGLWKGLLATSCALCAAAAASAEQDLGEFEGTGFARDGFYVGVGASFGFPNINSSGFHGEMEDLANTSAEASAAQVPLPTRVESIEPADIHTTGMRLDETRFGVGAVAGYRFSRYAALEVEGEWLADRGQSTFTVVNSGDMGTVEVSELWALTANLRVYPFGGRFQPFGIFGLGLIHSRVDIDIETQNLTTPAMTSNPTGVIDLPANFVYQKHPDQIDGGLRAGVGMDAYLTEHVAAEIKADYVFNFSPNIVETNWVSVRLGILYRF